MRHRCGRGTALRFLAGAAVAVAIGAFQSSPVAALTPTPSPNPVNFGAGSTSGSGSDLTLEISQIDVSGYPHLKIYVTVTGPAGRPVEGLLANTFTVTEDGKATELVDVKNVGDVPGGEPIKIVLALDTSSSVSGQAIEDIKQAAKAFVEGLNPRDKIAVMSFSDEVNEIHTFTNNTIVIGEGIDSLRAGGRTSLYEAVYRAAEVVDEQEGRRAFVLLTDGWNDSAKKRTLDEATDRAVAAKAPGYVLGFGGVAVGEDNDEALKRIAADTGGRYLRKPLSSDIEALFTELTGLLTSQYVITYDTGIKADDSSHDVTVKVTRGSRSASDTMSVKIAPSEVPTQDASSTPRAKATIRSTPTVHPSPTPIGKVTPPAGYICSKKEVDGSCSAICKDADGDHECDPGFPMWIIGALLALLALAVAYLATRRRTDGEVSVPREIIDDPTVLAFEPGSALGPIAMGGGAQDTMISKPPIHGGAWLIGLSGEVSQRRFPLSITGRGETSFGRLPTNTYAIDGSGTVSRNHALIKLENGQFVLRDLGARNPTTVNGRNVTRVVLSDGDEVTIGNLRFVFKRAAAGDAPTSAKPDAGGNG